MSIALANTMLKIMRDHLTPEGEGGWSRPSNRAVARAIGVSESTVSNAATRGMGIQAARNWCRLWEENGFPPITLTMRVKILGEVSEVEIMD